MTALSYFISCIKRNHGSWNTELCITLRAMAVHVLQGVEPTAVKNNTEGAIFLTILNLQRERGTSYYKELVDIHRCVLRICESDWFNRKPFFGASGCLPFTGGNRLVYGLCKW